MLQAGERPDVVADHLGHSDVATTMGIYADVTAADKRKAAARLQRAWDEAASLTSAEPEVDKTADNVVPIRRAK